MTSIDIPPIPPYVPSYLPIGDVTPLTYRDGQTFLGELYGLRDYVNGTFADYVKTTFTTLGDEFNTEVNQMITTVNQMITDIEAQVTADLAGQNTHVDQEIASLTTYIDSAVASIINSTIAVTDPVIMGVLNDLTTNTRKFFDGRYSLLHDIDVFAFGAVGDGIADDTAALQAAITAAVAAHKPLLIPYGLFLADGLTVTSVDGFRMNVIGRIKRRNNSARTPIITFSGCTNLRIDGLRTNGNVANNLSTIGVVGLPFDEAKHDVTIDNCANVYIRHLDSINPAGDSLYIKGGDAANSADIQIDSVSSVSTATTGRNAVSIIKGQRIQIGKINSVNTGYQGQAAPAQIAMPGGFDIEPNSANDIVTDVTVGEMSIQTAGSPGFSIFSNYGQIIERVTIGSVIVKRVPGAYSSGSGTGKIAGAKRVKIGTLVLISDGIATGASFDNCDGLDIAQLTITGSGSNGLVIGPTATVTNSRIVGRISSSAAHGVAVYNFDNSIADLIIKDHGNPSAAVAKIAAGTSSNITWRGDWAKATTGGLLISSSGAAGITNWEMDTVDCTGWAAGTRFTGGGASLANIRKINCRGVNTGTAAPNFDYWAQGDIVWNTNVAAAGTPGWVCVTPGVPPTGVFKAMASVAA